MLPIVSASALVSIPSPSSNAIGIWKLNLNFYGLCIGIGVLVAIYIAQRRWAERGGDPEEIAAIATWVVPAGLIGARAYHIITDWRPFSEWLKVWEGGLGIPGGLLTGVLTGVWIARRRGIDLGNAFDAAIPGIPIAQAIGRLGNWFNQEIFGGPTGLPWAVEIDAEHRPAEFAANQNYHPAFLYEALWNVALAVFLVRLDRRGVLKRGMILPVWIAGYGIGRFLVESVRIDAATLILGIRVNHWVSGSAVLFSVLAIWFLYRNAGPSHWADGGSNDVDDLGADGPDDDAIELDTEGDPGDDVDLATPEDDVSVDDAESSGVKPAER